MTQKKYIILSVVTMVSLMILVGVIYFFREYKNVTFTTTYTEASATLSDSDKSDKSIGTITNNSSLWLKKQTYYVHFTDEKLNDSRIPVTIDDKTTTISLDPHFSNAVLADMLKSEKQAIDNVIKSTIESSATYTEGEKRLYHHGEWASAELMLYQSSSDDPNIGNPDNVDTYYVIMKKTASGWSVTAGPDLIITKPGNPSVPSYVIDDLATAHFLR